MPSLVQEMLRAGEFERNSQRRKTSLDFEENEVPLHDRCVHELFETEVEQSPETIALVCGQRKFTYRELNARANQLAHFLMRFGVGPNTLVGLCVNRSPEMVVGILGILKAGGAYVPIDPSWSQDRLAYTLDDSGIFLLLTQSCIANKLPRHDGPRLSLDGNWDVIAKERKTNPRPRATPRNLAYSVYSAVGFSDPKGVRISHRGLLNYLSWGVEAFQVAKGTELSVDSSISFDLAITRVLSQLMFGHSIYLERDGLTATA